jgi:predicted CXXCH cytochrome family protein
MMIMLSTMASASFLEMLTPPGYLSTTSDHMYLVGRTDAPAVEIIVNTIKRYEVPVKDSVFHKYLYFGFGLNEISIRPLNEDTANGKNIATMIEILSSPYSTGRLAKLYPLYQFHGSRGTTECSGCHSEQFGISPDSSEIGACTTCHTDFAGRTLLHSELKKEDCVTCHNQQTNQARVTSGNPQQNPCYNCHPDKIRKFNQEYIHGPVAGGSCAVCHDPHGSPYNHSLINVEEVLCFTCHEFGRESREMPVQHKPFRDGNCGACHDPHATGNRWVLAKSSEKLCFECHSPDKGKFKDHIHPYNVKPKKQHLSSVKLSDSGTLECLSCHNPHASRSEHLLRSKQEITCLGCHTEKL